MVSDNKKPPISKAVAIEYNDSADAPPIITSSGHGRIADEILAIAFARGIKVREDADLDFDLSTALGAPQADEAAENS